VTNEELISMAAAVRDRAYAPYSRFRVGAALLGTDGRVYVGCNVESAAFGAGLCAERAAIAQAVAAGCRNFVRGAVISSGSAVCTPCGICRQMLYECSPKMEILCCRGDGSYEMHTAEELLPWGFGDAAMGK
jgi:cytidine deaminase